LLGLWIHPEIAATQRRRREGASAAVEGACSDQRTLAFR